MNRIAVAALLLFGAPCAFAAQEPWRAAWHQVEVFPEVQPGAIAYDDKAACERDLEASEDMVLRCAYLAKPEDAHDAAIAVFSDIIKNQPKNDVVINQRGNLYFQKGDTESAIADYTLAMKLKPDDFWAYVLRGQAYQKAGKRDKAIADYKAAIARHPDADMQKQIEDILKKLDVKS